MASHFRLGLILLVFVQNNEPTKKQKVRKNLAILYVVWINRDGSPVYNKHPDYQEPTWRPEDLQRFVSGPGLSFKTLVDLKHGLCKLPKVWEAEIC